MLLAIGETSDTPADQHPEQLRELERVSLCEALDRILNKGAVVSGELTIAVANVDLLYLNLQLVLTSVASARKRLASG